MEACLATAAARRRESCDMADDDEGFGCNGKRMMADGRVTRGGKEKRTK